MAIYQHNRALLGAQGGLDDRNRGVRQIGQTATTRKNERQVRENTENGARVYLIRILGHCRSVLGLRPSFRQKGRGHANGDPSGIRVANALRPSILAHHKADCNKIDGPVPPGKPHPSRIAAARPVRTRSRPPQREHPSPEQPEGLRRPSTRGATDCHCAPQAAPRRLAAARVFPCHSCRFAVGMDPVTPVILSAVRDGGRGSGRFRIGEKCRSLGDSGDVTPRASATSNPSSVRYRRILRDRFRWNLRGNKE